MSVGLAEGRIPYRLCDRRLGYSGGVVWRPWVEEGEPFEDIVL